MGPFNFVQGDSSPSTRLRNIIKNITIRRQTFGLALGQGDRMTTPLVVPSVASASFSKVYNFRLASAAFH